MGHRAIVQESLVLYHYLQFLYLYHLGLFPMDFENFASPLSLTDATGIIFTQWIGKISSLSIVIVGIHIDHYKKLRHLVGQPVCYYLCYV
ncbi:hypothetical protein AWC38_SpisGene16188 [Stylophora pistillata]|uniref:Uncharacterized protein n=1 Tax=Stylophora pistillata TaxID=50429 RepID=A0A2B4RLW6_STYPI|nr:hypothetical protein AWC38_SpisGene16188 [Stylophora pistillata]